MQNQNAPSPIEVTELGMVIDFKSLQLQNAYPGRVFATICISTDYS